MGGPFRINYMNFWTPFLSKRALSPLLFFLLWAGFFLVRYPSLSAGQDDGISSASLSKALAIADELVNVDFEPKRALILEEADSGRVAQYPAVAVPLSGNKSRGSELIVGAAVLISHSDTIHYSFFLAGKDGQFAATEVRQLTLAKLKENSVTIAALSAATESLRDELNVKKVQLISFDEKLAELRGKASQLANIDEIIDLRMKVQDLKQAEEKNSAETERLQALLEKGKQQKDSAEIDTARREIAVHLQEAAKVTALADRLEEGRKDSASQTFAQKLALVKEMDEIDPKELASQVLQVRKRRRELENRLGITSSDGQADQF